MSSKKRRRQFTAQQKGAIMRQRTLDVKRSSYSIALFYGGAQSLVRLYFYQK